MSNPLELKQLTIHGTAEGPRLLVTGGVHGDEFEPMEAIRRLARCWPKEQMRGHVTLVPVVNEAAFQRRGRTAWDDLDLARTCPGDPHGTITQQTAAALSTLIRSADYYIDLHTGGSHLMLMPMIGYVLHPDAHVLDQQRAMARAFNLPIIWGTSAQLQGRSLSVARDAGVAALYAEYGGGARLDPEGVEAYVQGCLNVARSLDMVQGVAPLSRIRYVVEDNRPQSGHLQLEHPAPREGFFEPLVKLGDTVQGQQTIGRVVDVLGNRPQEVRAIESGIVLMLRTFPRVEVGDALAALLPISAPGERRIDS